MLCYAVCKPCRSVSIELPGPCIQQLQRVAEADSRIINKATLVGRLELVSKRVRSLGVEKGKGISYERG